MKKLLSLLSVLTISGTAVPTTIAASPYQKEENIKNIDINYFQKNNLEKLNRNKRDFESKEHIEFFNNNFFYKFNIKYDNEKRTDGAFDNSASIVFSDSITLIKDWSKYANSWEEFSTKFPEIELINFKSIIADHEIIETSFKIKNIKTEKSEWSKKDISNFFDQNYLGNYRSYWKNNANKFDSDINELNNYIYDSFVCAKRGKILFRLYIDNKELKAQIIYKLMTSSCTTSYKGLLKFDSIRLVGQIDVNPLFLITVEKAKQFDIWASSIKKELEDKRKDNNYNKNNLLNEENSFKENFKLWLLQIKHDYIQDLINIDQNNEIIGLKSEIDKIKSRLNKLEESKTCLENIFDSFKKNTLSDAPGDAWKSIKENADSPLKIIIKKSGKAIAAGLVTGIAKGSALGVISCVAESIF